MISLVNVPNKYPLINSRTPPIGIGYICSYLKSKGINSVIFDFDIFPLSIIKSVEIILNSNPKIVGFTCYSQNYFIIKKFCEIIKKKRPDVITVIGGPAASFAFDDILSDTSYIDLCVIGEGEKTLEEIYNKYNGKKDELYNIKGIAFKNNEKIIVTPKRPLITKLDEIPSPYLSEVFDLKYYSQMNISTSRGCPMKCIYCVCGAMFGAIRFHSPKRVLDEVDYIYESNLKLKWSNDNFLFNFTDDTFTYSDKHVNLILDGLEERNYKINWSATTRIMSISEELLIRMKKVGLKMVNFGLESADPYILKILNKLNSKDDSLGLENKFLKRFKDIVIFSRKLGLDVFISYILRNPYETKEMAQKTIKLCLVLDRKFGAKYIPNILVPFKGTKLYKDSKNYNIEIDKDPEFLLPYYIKKHPFININDLVEIFPYNHRFFIHDEIYNKSAIHFKKINAKSYYISNNLFRKQMIRKFLKKN